MAYIGNVPAEKYIALTQQTFSSPTGTSFTLSQAVTNPVDIDLYIDNVKQDPASYSVSGTALTTSTIASPSTMYCIYNGKAMQTVNPPDDSVGLAQLAGGTDGNIISYDASGNPVAVATGTDGQVLTSTGAGSPPAFEALPASGITLGTAVASTSGTAIGFTSIPAGTKRITLTVNDVSIDAATQYWIQIGDSGGYETSGYLGSGVRHSDGSINTITTGFLGQNPSATPEYSGQTILTLANSSSNTWTCMGIWGADTAEMMVTGGRKSLSGVLDRIQITTASGSANFNSGEVNISYE